MLSDIKYENIIKTRTSKIIGGYVTEHKFLETFIDTCDDVTYTKGWWYGTTKNIEKEFFFVAKENLNSVDIHTIKFLNKINFECWQVFNVNGKLHLRSTSDILNETGKTLSTNEFLKYFSIPIISHGSQNPKQCVESLDIDKCIEFFKNNNLLETIANSIQIEDSFLNKYFYTSNIDYILQNTNNDLFILEIKFKDETKNNKFGVDLFQVDKVYKPFIKNNIFVYNIILHNDLATAAKDKNSTKIFDSLIAKKDLAQNLNWLYYSFNKTKYFESYNIHKSEKHSDWERKKARSVYYIPKEEYKKLNNLSLITSTTCPECNGKLVIRESQGNKFLGCTNFPILKCTYTKNI